MVKRFVIDTNCLINYYHDIFNERNKLSQTVRDLIKKSIAKSGDVYLIIPSIVLVEIYFKFFKTEEFAKKFYFEIYLDLIGSPFIEIRSIDNEVLENLVKIDGIMLKHELHDKIVLASAMVLDCPLITYDSTIIKYVNSEKIIPLTLS